MITVLLITRTALYYAIILCYFVDELGLNPTDLSHLKKQLSEKFHFEHAKS